ncbi:MAG TPA: hypothetical protein VLC09_03560 [Polyangiaceae bacterium]|nr:hypothetical protein [Polyangiaceae bacterium]
MKKPLSIAAALWLVACGGSQEPGIKTQEDRLNEQLALADEQNAKDDEYNSRYEASKTESEQAEQFDKANAEHELKRATLSAVTCPDTFTTEQLVGYKPGTATLVVTFGNQGDVTEATIAAPYTDTVVGDCVLQAIKPVRIKIFSGPPQKMDWTIELPPPKKPEKKDAKKK